MDPDSLLNKKAPLFSLKDQDDKTHDLGAYLGKWVVVYFYPKDDTPESIKEMCDFRDRMEQFKNKDVVVLGVSKDSAPSHFEFVKKLDLNFPLLSDEKMEVIRAYGAWGVQKFMGKEFPGVLQTTFLIDPQGFVRKVYAGPKPDLQAKIVLADLHEFTG